jgi:TolB-like protein/protein involved in temperature-dependent protein secretion
VQLEPGARIAHYHIVAALGAGGMGEVYRATDTRLGRDVALKVLPANVSASTERLERFQREARALAALDHPGIVTVYSVEEHEGVQFLTMQLVDGEQLDRVIPEDGLPLERVIAIATALAEALAAAHDKGIVHRDLKPANVMIAKDGRVKVLDFGLARVTQQEPSGDSELPTHLRTREGVVMGTVPYMSPEQVSGRELDQRTDIFSLGIILYEMASGRRPFHGESSAELASAILRDSPRPLGELRGNLPETFRRAIERCLEKSPSHRYASAHELREALRGSLSGSSPSGTTAAPAARAHTAADSGAARAREGFWIAVLPFKYRGNDADLTSFAEGLTESIVTGLSRFSYLRVVAHGTIAHLGSQAVDVRSAGGALGARYVLEGSLRQAGTKVRLMVQLVDTESGAHLWSESYDRSFDPAAALELQDELLARIVSICADRFGVLARSISDAVRGRDPEQLTPYEALMRAFGYHLRLTPAEHAEAREALERAVERAPSNADCWAMLSWLYSHEHAHGFNVRPDPLERALGAARRAVDIAPSNSLAQQVLAVVLFFRKEKTACLSAADRAIALNPLDTSSEAIFLLAFTGDWDRGCELIRWAMQLNPHHPRWYEAVLALNEYRLANYRAAVDEIVKANAPEIFWMNMMLAAAHAQLGEFAAAREAVRDLLAQKNDFAETAPELLSKWFEPQLIAHLIEGFRKAGLEIVLDKSAEAPALDLSKPPGPIPGEARAEEGFWVAVLPFRYSGNNSELTSLAEGLTEDIITGLSRFSYLRVIARGSTAGYSTESGDVRATGKSLGARYVMEGSLRQAGARLRLAVQLVDAESGAHLWAENFERNFSSEALFELQDDLVPRIVSTVADTNGILARSMSEVVRRRDPEELTPYEAVLRSFGYGQRVTPEELTAARAALGLAVRKAPAYADAWAMLAWLHLQDYAQGFNLEADSLLNGLTAARRAVDLAPSNHLAWFSLAQALFFQKEFESFRNAAEKSVELNPMDGNSIAFLGELLNYAGDAERGLALAGRAKQLNPNYPGWYWYADFYDAYRRGDDRAAAGFALKINLPGQWFSHAAKAAAYGQLREAEAAGKAVRDLLRLRPDFTAIVRKVGQTWWEPEYLERMIDGWRKAGLEIAPEADSADVPRRPATRESAVAGTNPEQPGAPLHESTPASGAVRADEGFWVAVLPFKYSGSNTDLTALAEGLTEEIVTGLSRFAYLHVVAPSSLERVKSGASDIRKVGKELGARYVMEGSVRQAGSLLRVSVQLLDATSGTHLWAETFDRSFRADDVFSLQDALVPLIVSTVADQHGVLVHQMADVLRNRRPEELTPNEAVLSVFGFHERMSPEEHAALRDVLERVVRDHPDQGNCWAMLETLYCDEYMFGFNVRPDSLGRALAAARRAVEVAPTSNLASQALAQALFFRREWSAFRPLAERTIALNRMDGATVAFMGILLACSGEWERGCEAAQSAMQLNPHFPGWYRLASLFDSYRQHDYRGTVDICQRINIPGYFWTLVMSAAALGQMGEVAAAQAALRELLANKPDFSSAARAELGGWFDEALVAHVIEGLKKAGLEIVGETKTSLRLPDPARPPSPQSGAARAEEGFWVAVLPFKYGGGNADLTALAEGLTEDIVTGLSRFSYLRVIARSSTARYARESVDVRTAGKELGARYVMEGTLRHAGAKLRLAVQLVDATTGAHLWAENYERTFSPETIFELQDELVPPIVSTVADWYGILPHSMSEALRGKPVDQLSPYESLLRGFGYFERVTPEEHAAARPILERAVEEAPGHAAAWAMLSMLYGEEHRFGFNLLPDPLGRALRAARRAVEAAPGSHVCHLALAQAHYFRKEFEAFRNAAERAVALNPLDGATVEYLAHLLAFAGDWERGCELGERARKLNPNHPPWYWALPILDAFRRGDYDGARALIPKGHMPGQYYSHALFAALYGRMGEREAAEEHLREALALQPDLAAIVRAQFSKWYLPQLVEQLLDGLRKAGLEIAPEATAGPVSGRARSSPVASGPTRAEEGFWVGVLPFKYSGGNTDLMALAEGLTEEIVTGLSRFSYLRVIARSSTARYANESVDVRSAGKELGARYVMEASLRQAGTKLRLAVQLVDTISGAHLWAENYERAFHPDTVFELQDDMVPRIVATIADIHGVLAQSMSGVLRSRASETLTPYEAVLRSFGYLAIINAEEHAEVRAALERAVDSAPGNADALAMVSTLYADEYKQGFNAKPDPLGRALDTARRAVASAPSNHLAYQALAQAHFFRKELPAFRIAADRALAHNPMDAFTTAYIGILLAYAGDWERGVQLVERAMELNPNHPGWYRFVFFNDALRRGEYQEALAAALNFNMPTYFFTHAALATAYGLLGDLDSARNALRELLVQKPDFHLVVREELGKWLEPVLLERNLDGLRKAGLEIADEQSSL